MDFMLEFQALQQEPQRPGHASRFQDVCESFWACLEDDKADVDSMNAFIDLLRHRDNFELARLVVPELRSADVTSANAYKRHILSSIDGLRAASVSRENVKQADFDDELYCAEKDIYLDAQVYRARLLLHDSAPLKPARMEDIRDWLAQRPGRDGDTQGQ